MTDDEKQSYEERRARTRKLAAEFNEKGDPLGWFDALYKEAEGDSEKVPWADMEPNRYFREWAESKGLKGDGRSALVVGCGLGDDAKYLDDLGFIVTAFDISPTAIDWAGKHYADSNINFQVGDLFKPDSRWLGAFDFVLEIYTIQPLPLEMRSMVIDSIAAFVAPGGRLVVVTRGREDGEDVDIVPWPLSREELARFGENGLAEESFDDIWDAEDEQRRFVIEYRRR